MPARQFTRVVLTLQLKISWSERCFVVICPLFILFWSRDNEPRGVSAHIPQIRRPMHQPIQILHVGSEVTNEVCAEILRCEGFPFFETHPAEGFDGMPPGVQLLVVAGTGLNAAVAGRLAKAVAQGACLIAMAPDAALAAAFGVTLGEPVRDAHVGVIDLPGWEHGAISLFCPDEVARPMAGGQPVAMLYREGDHAGGAGIVEVRPGKGRAWLYGYDLCRTIVALRHGTGRLEPPVDQQDTWSGPRALYGFWELAEKLPHDVPVADLHQDILRSIMTAALGDAGLPRLWHFPEGAPALWLIRGDGCGEEGAEVEVEVVERYGAYLSFCRPLKSRYSGELMREWHGRGHGISIEANINHITQPRVEEGPGKQGRRMRTVAELNERWLPAIRAHLEEHRDSFRRETGLEMETFMTHSAQWTGLPMARLVEELGWRTLLPFQSHDPRVRPGDRKGPYLISTALPMRYFDRDVGVLDLWHVPFHWIDVLWQFVAKYAATGQKVDPESVRRELGMNGDDYGEQLARSAEDAARRWHGAPCCSFHPCYVSSPWPVFGSSRRALEMGLEGARAAGCGFANLEQWSRFFRGRAGVRLKARWRTPDAEFVTLESSLEVAGLTVLMPDRVEAVRSGERGENLPLREFALEGRQQQGIVVDLPEKVPLTLCMRRGPAWHSVDVGR